MEVSLFQIASFGLFVDSQYTETLIRVELNLGTAGILQTRRTSARLWGAGDRLTARRRPHAIVRRRFLREAPPLFVLHLTRSIEELAVI